MWIDRAKLNWHRKWKNRSFRIAIILGVLLVICVLIFTYHFFAYIEAYTGGVVLNDWVLSHIPAKDLSVPIVSAILSVIVLFLIRSVTNPDMFVTFVIGFLFLFIARIITIDITRFQPPVGLIELKDPIAGIVYKAKFIKRDLFFSGHTSVLFLFYLCSQKKTDKYYMLPVALIVGFLLLVQHVHYTIDVLCAPLFALCSFWLSKKILLISGAVEGERPLRREKVRYIY